MKRLILIFAFAIGTCTFIRANPYKIDEQKLAQTFEKSVEVSFDELYAKDISAAEMNFSKAGGEKTKVGYLVRAWFCGGIALHRYYMGTNKSAMWAMYLCIPFVGWVAARVDFWWVVIDDEALAKFADNDKYLVWMD